MLFRSQGTLKSLLQNHTSKASILWPSAFFIVQLSHLYMTTGKTIALTGWTFVGKVMSLLSNKLSRFVIAFLPRSKVLLISLAAVTICSDFGAPQNKVHGIRSHPFMANRWGNDGNSEIFYFLGLQKSLHIMTAAKKLKDTCSLEEKL